MLFNRVYSINNLPILHVNSAITVGNFDGVHLGHQALIRNLCYKAKLLNLESIVVLFEPHALEVINKNIAPLRLTSLREKLELLKELNVERVICLKFNDTLRHITGKQFIENILLKLNCKYICTGKDFVFGHNKSGNTELLKNYQHLFEFVEFENIIENKHKRISSTLVRSALEQACTLTASKMLGRYYSITGKVAHGRKLARTFGTPTANICLKRNNFPLKKGVYLVRTYIGENECLGVANIGLRPTVESTLQTSLEVHIFAFNGNLYGRKITIEFLHFLRSEQKFTSLEALKQAIKQDIDSAQKWVTTNMEQYETAVN